MYAAAFLLSLPLLVRGHAKITSPPIRAPGQSFLSACGQPSFKSVQNDPTGHIEEQEPVNAGCELTLCRGMKFEDQPASNVQQVIPGQAMAMAVDCTVPHGGPANVSLIDTTGGGAGTYVGSFLKTFDDFCPTSGQTPADQTNLQFTLPSADIVGNKCQTAGDCVVQLFWATPDFSQNYYYCVDVAMSAPSIPAASSAIVSSPAVSSALVTSIPAASSAIVSSPTAVSSALVTSVAAPSKMVTSFSAPTPSAVPATNAAAVANPGSSDTNSTVSAVAQSNAASRRSRILFF